ELKLGIESHAGKKVLVAVIRDNADFGSRCVDAIRYAKRLVDDIQSTHEGKEFKVTLRQQVNFGNTLTEAKLKSFVEYFNNEAPISPYDEIRRKNLLLQELAE